MPIKNPQKKAEANALIDAIEADLLELSQKYSGQEIPEEAKAPIFLLFDKLHGILRRNWVPAPN
jgi:hypothetical protein